MARTTACITAPEALVLQADEGKPLGSGTSRRGFCVGNIVITTDGEDTFTVTQTATLTPAQ